jgi:hypothetical protein
MITSLSCSKSLLCDNIIELLFGNKPIVISVGPVDHLLKFSLVDGFAQFLGHSPQILDRDKAGLLVVKQVKDLPDILPGVLVGDSGCHQIEELLKVDLP